MIQLASKKLVATVQNELNRLQKKIDGEAVFVNKVKQAQALWGSKGGKKGKDAFVEVIKELKSLCVFTEVCNYCEQNEGGDIEHIFPKSFFPQHTFQWENYILACKQCNSGYKLDKCYVIDAHNNLVQVARGTQPVSTIGAFINPRLEDPNHFLMLNMLTYTFEILPGLNKKDNYKANTTLQILALNDRDILKAARKSAAKYYFERMERLVKMLNCTSKKNLEKLLNPYDKYFDWTLALVDIKTAIKESHKKEIASYQHPSVWYAIKTIQSKIEPKWKAIFKEIPEALHW
jgi:uncharacterized protein (TIGR02646 family)